MPALWKTILSSARSERLVAPPADPNRAHVTVNGQRWPVRLLPNARARRLTMRFDRMKGEIRLSLPLRYDRAKALVWIEGQHRWLTTQIGTMEAIVAVENGADILYQGELVRVIWQDGGPRRVTLQDGVLHVGGPEDTVPRRIERWMKAEALALLADETLEYAAIAGLKAGRVSVADPKSRWGSCASDGNIRYNWRLVMAPDFVRRATVAHEVAHLRHMHHGPEFHALVDEIFEGSARKARRWLKAEGHKLHQYRFD